MGKGSQIAFMLRLCAGATIRSRSVFPGPCCRAGSGQALGYRRQGNVEPQKADRGFPPLPSDREAQYCGPGLSCECVGWTAFLPPDNVYFAHSTASQSDRQVYPWVVCRQKGRFDRGSGGQRGRCSSGIAQGSDEPGNLQLEYDSLHVPAADMPAEDIRWCECPPGVEKRRDHEGYRAALWNGEGEI